jgi:uncharacterized lipoprotein YehR (DUF1307 family)
MKKKFALILALVMVCATMLTACDGKKAENDLTGTTWTLNSMTSAGEEYSYADLDGMGMIYTYEFKEDGVAVYSGYDEDGTWKQDGNSVTITVIDISITGEIKDNELIIDEGLTKMIYKKN